MTVPAPRDAVDDGAPVKSAIAAPTAASFAMRHI
jgi:hypothetical protein